MESLTQERPTPTPPSFPELITKSSTFAVLRPRWLLQRIGKWTIEQRVLAGFGLVFAGILVISAVSYRNLAVVVQNSKLDTKSHDLMRLLVSIEEALNEAESGHRRFLVTGDESYLKTYHSIMAQMPEYSRYLHLLVDPGSEKEVRINKLEELIGLQLDSEAQAIRQRRQAGAKSVRHLAVHGVATPVLDEIHRLISGLESEEQTSARNRFQTYTASTRKTIALLAFGAMLQFLLLGSVYYLIRHDIMERRRVAAELRQQGDLLQAANNELEAFSYSVSHDLRAPLRHIDGYAALLSKAAGSSLNEKARRYLQTISDSAKQMGQLIDDLLVFSRMGRQEMLCTTVSLDQLAKTVITDLHLDLQGKAISWTIGLLPDVQGDPAMLRQVFVNLITNAVKFTATRDTPRIEIGAFQDRPDAVTVFVRDNGVGFDMQYVNKLFGVFQRLHRNDEFEGTGIGLANVRRIIHRHGGETWAEGALDQGATFFFSLPKTRTFS